MFIILFPFPKVILLCSFSKKGAYTPNPKLMPRGGVYAPLYHRGGERPYDDTGFSVSYALSFQEINI